ncbi:sensor histidine kinase [Paenibacillus sp. MBLB4367]|uniref:sensor histidine kinase n=1 Tax=Paenibacillus sp. MBLB4367 TaxID=3384767 RepID=UPI003907F685
MFPTIKAKFLVGFLIIFSVSLLVLNQAVVRIIERSNENIMTQDLIGLKKNSGVYVKQAFMINHFDNDEMYFQQMAKEMAEELRYVTSSAVGAYSVKGDLLFATDEAKFDGGDDDLKQALTGKTAYSISYANGLSQVYYSYLVDGSKVGILRFSKDFTYLYEQSRTILDIIFYATLAIFAAAFLFSYILSRNMTIPLVRLAKASTEVANGNLDIRIEVKRRDEIGMLADNFSKMIGKIKAQILRIEQDRDRLEELNRHRKQFFDNVTHELKTPLTTILGYAEMIKENGRDDAVFFGKGMNHIVDESKRLHVMVLRLLELSKESSGLEAFEIVDAGRILSEVCDGMAIKAERYGKSIQCGAEAGLLVSGNADKLRQLFINVLDNAIKYSDPHSEIAVSARRAVDQVNLSIINQSEDIPPEHLEHLFEPFYRADKRKAKEQGSNGLGLSICQTIVQDHQGSLGIESANRKTVVAISLPAADDEREG